MLTILVVSDATGETAERVVRAALTQFEDADTRVIRCRDVRSADQVRQVATRAANENAVLVHTLVSDQLRRLMLDECRRANVDALDMLGPLLDRLAGHLGLTPQEKPGLFRQLVEARSREIEAVEYAFHHDDGQHVDELDRAEVVLVGVSRTMKTPTMLFLAYRGWFAANVPLVPGLAPPAALLQVPRPRVFCLAMAPSRLCDLRRVRARNEGIPEETYAAADQVRRELDFARDLCRRHGWRSVDVTGKSVEEVGREIIAALPESPAR